MERLALHIEYLLLRHDCVVVPGFGAFINVYHSALEDSKTHGFQPMTTEVRFNSALKHNDGMLATSYARRERVSYAEGREMVRVAVSDLLDTLALEGEVSIGRIGRIRTDNSGNLSFHPLLTPNRLAAALGYLPVKRHAPVIEAAPAAATAVTETETAEPVVENPVKKFDTDRNYYIPINKMFARMAASFAVVAVLCLSLILPFTRDYHEDQASVVPVKAITTAVTKASQQIQAVEQPAPAAEPEVQEAAPQPKTWHLVVGTFRSQDEADNFISSKNDSPYELHTVASKRMVRVVAISATDKETLLPELNSPEFQSAFPQAWIFHQQ
jgi:hypothetical protein